MAMKKPVLSNSLPGVVLEIEEGNGVIFAKNQKDLIKKIGELIPHKNELKNIGYKGYEYVKARYTWPIVINKFKKILINLFQGKKK